MRFAIYADLSRHLDLDEQQRVFTALDTIVPDSGCVGPNRRGDCEVYFVVTALSAEAARYEAAGYLDAVLRNAGLSVSYALTLQPQDPAEVLFPAKKDS